MNATQAVDAEYGERKRMFQKFVEAIKAIKTLADEPESPLSFEQGQGNESEEDVTFSYRGRRLRIRHSFDWKGYPPDKCTSTPECIAMALQAN